MATVAWLMAAGCDTVSGIDDLVFERGVGSFCESSDACGEGLFCDLELQTCAVQDPRGVSCNSHAQCVSGRCVDGFCCDGPCNVPCLACDLPGDEGNCGVVAAGDDPHNDCPGTAQCGADGRCQGLLAWSQSYGDAGVQRAVDVVVDGDDNFIVLGTFQGTMTFQTPLQTAGATDVFVAKFDSQSELVWSYSIGGSGDDQAAALATDMDGNIYVAGAFTQEVSFDNGPVAVTADGVDGFILKLRQGVEVDQGTHEEKPVAIPVWVHTYGGPGDQVTADVAVATNGRVVVAGSFDGDIDYGGDIVSSAGLQDAFVVSHGADGSVAWHREYGDSERQEGSALSMDGFGSVVLAISGRGTVNSGLSTMTHPATENTDTIYLLELGPSGIPTWDLLFTDGGFGDANVGNVRATDLLIADHGGDDVKVWLTGSFTNDVVPPGGVKISAVDDVDGFFVRFDATASGAHELSGGLLGPFADVPRGIAIDPLGNVIVTGRFELSIHVQLDQMDPGQPIGAVGGQDVFLMKLSGEAQPIWGQPFGGPLSDEAVAVATDSKGNIIIVGHFEHRIDLQGLVHESDGGTDFFVAKFAP